ncbi:MAG: hypothetical protein ACRC33_24445 [Gemmataceae bacterium]
MSSLPEEGDEPGGPPPELISGLVVPTSNLTLFGLFLASAGFFLGCGYLLYEWWLPDDHGVLPFRVTWWGAILCLVGFVIGLGGMIAFVVEFLGPKRLVVGDRSFQVVRGSSVELHVPYANVRHLAYEKRDDEGYVGIDLHDPDDPDTYAKDAGDLRQRDKKGRDCALDGWYTLGLQEVARLIEKKWRKAT